MKTKEEILDKYDCYEHEYVRYLDAIEAMEGYSNHQLEEQRKKIEELRDIITMKANQYIPSGYIVDKLNEIL